MSFITCGSSKGVNLRVSYTNIDSCRCFLSDEIAHVEGGGGVYYTTHVVDRYDSDDIVILKLFVKFAYNGR